MRLFTGLSLPERIITPIESLTNQLSDAARVRWSPAQNLHITTKFIGQWPSERLPELESRLGAMPVPRSFSVSVAHLGYLPGPHRPKIFFAGVRGEAGLAKLAEITESTLSELGVKKEDHPYTPHLTLARLGRDPAAVQALRERVAQFAEAGSEFEFGSFIADRFHLYESKTGPAGSVYSVLASYPLLKAAA
jgi:RNA 2',3'-cyclic 3'-phosphodiesterase